MAKIKQGTVEAVAGPDTVREAVSEAVEKAGEELKLTRGMKQAKDLALILLGKAGRDQKIAFADRVAGDFVEEQAKAVKRQDRINRQLQFIGDQLGGVQNYRIELLTEPAIEPTLQADRGPSAG